MKRIDPRPGWSDVPCVVIGSGPSLSDCQLQLIRAAVEQKRCHAIAVNNTCQRAPWADVAYFGDYLAVREYLPKLRECCAEWVTISRPAAERYRVRHVPGVNEEGFGQAVVHMNGNSGAQAINLAMLWGAKRVLLVGFDMRRIDGLDHWFGQHQQPLIQTQLYADWIRRLAKAAPGAVQRGVEIINCTPGSALTCFKQGELDMELVCS